jgi:hypothetical protein
VFLVWVVGVAKVVVDFDGLDDPPNSLLAERRNEPIARRTAKQLLDEKAIAIWERWRITSEIPPPPEVMALPLWSVLYAPASANPASAGVCSQPFTLGSRLSCRFLNGSIVLGAGLGGARQGHSFRERDGTAIWKLNEAIEDRTMAFDYIF